MPAINNSDYKLDDKYRELLSHSKPREGLARKTLRGGAAVMGAEIASTLLRFGSIIVLARLLLPEDFGLLAMVTALTIFAEQFKDFGLADATVQTKEITHSQISKLFWINLAICIGITLVVASLSKAIAWFYNEPRLVAVSLVIASTFLFSGLVIQHQALLRRQLQFGLISVINLCSLVLSLFVAIVLAYYDFGYWALVARDFSRAVFVVIGIWFACPWRPDLPRRGVSITRFVTFARNVTGFNIFYFFSHYFDKILIGKLFGPSWVGIYLNAYQLISLPVSQLQYPMNTVALPALSALQKEPSNFRVFYAHMIQLLTFFTMPLVAFLALFGDVIVILILGPKWMSAVPIFQILAIGAFVMPLVNSTGLALVASGNTIVYFRMGAINACSLVCCLSIGSFWGVMGVANGYSISAYLALFVCLVYGMRHTPILVLPLLRRIAPICFCSLFTAFIFLYVRYSLGWVFPPQWLAVFAIAGIATYLGLWLVIPGGRRILLNYWSYAKDMIRMGKEK